MSVRSILSSGRTAPRTAPGEETKEPGQDLVPALTAALQARIDGLSAELAAARTETAAARTETTGERTKIEALRAQLMEEAHQMSQCLADLATANATIAGLLSQVTTETQARVALQASLDNAVTLAAARTPISFPAHEPVAYEVVMVDPDNGKKKNVSIRPVKAKA